MSLSRTKAELRACLREFYKVDDDNSLVGALCPCDDFVDEYKLDEDAWFVDDDVIYIICTDGVVVVPIELDTGDGEATVRVSDSVNDRTHAEVAANLEDSLEFLRRRERETRLFHDLVRAAARRSLSLLLGR